MGAVQRKVVVRAMRILHEPPHGGKPDPVDRLRQILQHLPDDHRATVWEYVAASLAKRKYRDTA